MNDFIALRNIVDTWNMVEKYNIKGYVDQDAGTVLIPEDEYKRILELAKNKKYIQNLKK